MGSNSQNTKSKGPAPTVDQINADRITQLANQYWAPYTVENHLPFDDKIVEDIYIREIYGSSFAIRRIMMLEFSQYLENYLWPNYPFRKLPDHFPGFFQQMLEACLKDEPTVSLREQTALLVFLNHCFNSMEVELIRDQVKRLVSLSMWVSLQQGRREQELRAVPKWRKHWKIIQRKDNPEQRQKLDWERRFLQRLMVKFMKLLELVPGEGEVNSDIVHYCERFLELVIDLEALLPTRRFFNTVLDDCHLVVRCHLSCLPEREEGNLFTQVGICNFLLMKTVVKCISISTELTRYVLDHRTDCVEFKFGTIPQFIHN
ncbi:Intron-binding protein aquarius [Blattella germanica]|nr:Intron-binding protein aquarius [Blattella germanica]